LKCKELGHLPEELSDAQSLRRHASRRIVIFAGLPPGQGKRLASVCDARLIAKRSAKKCKELGHLFEELPEAGTEAAAEGLSAHNLFGSQAATHKIHTCSMYLLKVRRIVLDGPFPICPQFGPATNTSTVGYCCSR